MPKPRTAPSRAKTKARHARPRRQGPSITQRLAQGLAHLRPALKPAGLALAALLAAGASVYGWFAARSAAAQRLLASAPISPALIQIQWPPLDTADPGLGSWLPPELQAQVLDRAASTLAEHPDPLDPRTLSRAARDLEALGWFVERPRLRWTQAGSVSVDAHWHLPAALVRIAAADHLVSTQGVLMPVVYPSDSSDRNARYGFPLITGARSVGSTPAPDIQAALGVIAMLDAAGLIAQVRAVNVAGLNTPDRDIELISTRGTRIRWGSPPGDSRPGEMDAQAKVRALTIFVRDHGSIDADQDRPIDISTNTIHIDRLAK